MASSTMSLKACSPANTTQKDFRPSMTASIFHTIPTKPTSSIPLASFCLTQTTRLKVQASFSNSKLKNTEPETNRPLANFSPSMWGDRFTLISLNDDSKSKSDSKIVEEVRKMLVSCRDPVEKICLIETLCRLGVSYHFQNEIEDYLEKVFYTQPNLLGEKDYDLNTVALVFRVFRQHGYPMSCNVFNKFKNVGGTFKESLLNDTMGMLNLYEAAHLSTPGESIFDEALDFTKAQLPVSATQSNSHLGRRISQALSQPLHTGVTRIEARKYIDWYEGEEFRNETLLKFAKLDYNIVQFLHQQELSDLSKWWKGTNIATEYYYARDRLVEIYFWMVLLHFEPHHSSSRIMHCKIIALLTIIDDTYDSYGANEEHKSFTEAIQRWEYSAIDELPDYMKKLYRTLLDTFCEFEKELAMEGRSYTVNYVKKELKRMVRNYQTESDWILECYVPLLEEYFCFGFIKNGLSLMALASFMGMEQKAGVKEFQWVESNPKLFSDINLICTLLNDIASYEREKKRPFFISSIESYMKEHGVSKKETIEEFQKMMINSLKNVNEECLRPIEVPMDLIILVLNILRVAFVTYKGHKDAYSNPEHLKDYIHKLFIDPLSIE